MIGLLRLLWLSISMITQLRCFCVCDEVLAAPSPQHQNAVRSQRDLMNDVTIDQLPLVGVNLSSALFNEESKNDTQSLAAFQSLLQNGVQAFSLDLEERSSTWMVRQTNIQLSNFLTSLQSYINTTDDNLSANILVLLLKISSGGNSNTNQTARPVPYFNATTPSMNITNIVDQNLGRQRIYTPDDLLNDKAAGLTFNISGQPNSGWPRLQSFLYSSRRRVLIAELTNKLDSQVPYIFNSSILFFDEKNKSLN